MFQTRKKIFSQIILAFFLSGVASLIYQIVWFKELSYYMGNTTYAQSIVLAVFMGGLAIGNWIFGKKADTHPNSLRLFAIMELSIAIYCILFPFIFEILRETLLDLVDYFNWQSDGTQVFVTKFLIGSLLLLFPTILMGGTLPVLLSYLKNNKASVGKNVSLLYFINSLGAAIGSFFTGFILIESLGLRVSTYLAASFEILIGVFFLIISRKIILPSSQIVPLDSEKVPQNVNSTFLNSTIWAAALTGFSSMMYEIVWVRILIPIIGSTTYSFSIMLTSFIGGIAMGSFIINIFIDRIQNPKRFLGIIQLILVTSILLTLPVYQKLPYFFWSLVKEQDTSLENYSFILTEQFFYIFLLMFIPTVIMGMTLPLLNSIFIHKDEAPGKKVGKLFAVNTLGSVLGSIITSVLFIPVIGIVHSIELALVLNGILGCWFIYNSDSLKNKWFIVSFLSLLISGWVYIGQKEESIWVKSIMATDITRKINRETPPSSFEEFIGKDRNNEKLLYYKEGIGGTIVVSKKGNETALFTNGKGDANSIGDLPTQMSLAHIPMIVHPNPKDIFIIGFGTGTTAGNVLSHKKVEHVEVAEISKEVVEASDHFKHINMHPLKDQRLRMINDDGVSALRLSNNTYDVIISQPSNPWSAGVGNLFTTNFFADCKKHLNKKGILAQWFNLYEMDDKSLALMVRSMSSEFENISIWQVGSTDILFLCSESEFLFDLNRMNNTFNEVQEPMKKINISSFPVFLSQEFSSDLKSLIAYGGEGPLNTEDTPLLELWSPKALFYNLSPKEFLKLDQRSDSKSENLLLNQFLRKNTIDSKVILNLGLYQYYHGNKTMGMLYANRNPMIFVGLAQNEKSQANYPKALEYLEQANKISDTLIEIYIERASILELTKDLNGALAALSSAIELEQYHSELYFKRAVIFENLGKIQNAEIDYSKSLKIDPNNSEILNNLGKIKAKSLKYNEALILFTKAIKISPDKPLLYFNSGATRGMIGDYKGAIEDFTKAIQLDNSNLEAYYLRGKCFQKTGQNEKAILDWQYAASRNHLASKSILEKN